MKSKKILVYGYFGYENNQLDGQTIKTRSICELLKENSAELSMTVDYFDTQTFKKNRFNLLKSWYLISKYDILFYLPAHNNLKYLFPFIFFICKFRKIEIHYIVVGGWLSDFIKELPFHRKLLNKIKGIYPQTKDLTDTLIRSYSFKNVIQLHNFRFYKEFKKKDLLNENLQLVFMARINPQKGIKTLFKLSDRLFEIGLEGIRIDLYGQIEDSYKVEFANLLNTKKGNISYCGVLNPDNITCVLKKYDLFLFPTEYYTEGFPGSILDAYIAEVPVVVSRWKYADEFVINNHSGIICEFNNPNDFIDKTIDLISNKEKLKELNKTVKIEKYKYSTEAAWNILKSRILSINLQ